MIARILLCLITLNLTACTAATPQKAISYADTPTPQTIRMELPSAPVVATKADIVAENISLDQTMPSCKVGFDMILADASKKIQALRPM